MHLPLCAPQDPDDAFTFLLPRTHRDQDPAAAEDDDPAEAEEDEPLAVTRKRQREYERVADFVVVDEVALGRKENARRLTDRDLYITMLDNEVPGMGCRGMGVGSVRRMGCTRPLLSGWSILYRVGGWGGLSEAKKKFVYLKSTSKFGPL